MDTIRLANEMSWRGEVWVWSINIPHPIPPWCSGTAANLDEAKVGFRTAWEKFSASLTDEDVRRWHATQDARAAGA
jgi:hypothetical protein